MMKEVYLKLLANEMPLAEGPNLNAPERQGVFKDTTDNFWGKLKPMTVSSIKAIPRVMERPCVYRLMPYAVSAAVVAISSVIGMHMAPRLDEENFAMLYLLGVVFIAARYGRFPSIFACVLSVLSYQFFVVSPQMILMKHDGTCAFTFFVMLIVALTMSHLTARIRSQSQELDQRVRERTNELAEANHALTAALKQQLRAEEGLRGAVEELARSNTALCHFARIASHDLQEPLRSMRGFTQLLARRYKGSLDDKADQFIEHIEDCAYRMERLIEGILSHARVQGSEQQYTTVDLNAILEEAMQNLEVAMKESGAEIKKDELPVVKGDPLQLVQLFQNLLGNAVKFRGEKPPVLEIRCTPGAADENNFGNPNADPEWHISVSDNGIGFDTSYAEEIFGMFKRLHGRGAYPGSGIGLAICKTIVERHGGRIWVESREDHGSTFHFTMPA